MTARYLIFFFVFSAINVFSQVEFLHEITPKHRYERFIYQEYDDNLITVGVNEDFLYRVNALVLNADLVKKNSLAIEGTDAYINEAHEVIVVNCANHLYDVAEIGIFLDIKKYDADLNLVDSYFKNEFNDATDNDVASKGKIVPLDENRILIFIDEKRFTFNTSTFQLEEEINDPVKVGLSNQISWIDNERILIQNGTTFHLALSDGLIYETMEMPYMSEWIWEENHLWSLEGVTLNKRDNAFNIVGEFEFSSAPIGLQVGIDNNILISLNQSVYSINQSTLESTIIYETNYTQERIHRAFYFKDELHFEGKELKPFSLLGHFSSTIRNAIPINLEELPDIAISITNTEVELFDTNPDFSIYTLTCELEVENKTSWPLTHFSVVTSGDCVIAPAYLPQSCSVASFDNLNIPNGGKETVSFMAGYWYSTSPDNLDLNVYAYNPNEQYDKNYNDNFDSVTTSTKNPVAYAPIKVFPNPASDQIQLEIDPENSFSSLEIFNEMGQRIATYQMDKNAFAKTVDVSELASGMYTILLNGESTIHRSTFIKL